jgi:hypothetical protein
MAKVVGSNPIIRFQRPQGRSEGRPSTYWLCPPAAWCRSSADRRNGAVDGWLRRYALKVFSAHVELPAFVLIADADHEDLAAVDTKGAEILDDDAFPVEAWNLRDDVVADFE